MNNENQQDGIGNNADEYQEYLSFSQKYPTPEQAMLRLATEKALMNKQRKVWEWYNYDRLTFVEIAQKLKISKQAVEQQVKTIEKQIHKWCQDHMQAYEVIREAQDNANDQGC